MAHQPPDNAEGMCPGCYYRELYTSVANHRVGEPGPERGLVASYRFTEVPGGSEWPTPAHLREQTFARSDRRSMTFLCLTRTKGTAVEVRVLH